MFNATNCMSILADIFYKENCIEKLEAFTSINGALHYGCSINDKKIKLVKSKTPLKSNKFINCNKEKIIVFNPDFEIFLAS